MYPMSVSRCQCHDVSVSMSRCPDVSVSMSRCHDASVPDVSVPMSVSRCQCTPSACCSVLPVPVPVIMFPFLHRDHVPVIMFRPCDHVSLEGVIMFLRKVWISLLESDPDIKFACNPHH